MKKLVARSETIPAILLVLAFVAGAMQSKFFLDVRYLLDSSTLYVETGLLAIGMTFVIVSGNIDLSVASMIALVACVTARLMGAGWSIPAGCAGGLILGLLLGGFNGLLVAKVKLPSFVVTLATMAVYRGIAQVLQGAESAKLPSGFVGIDMQHLPGHVPIPLVILLLIAVVLGLVLQRTLFGRWVYSIGTNEEASFYAGLPTSTVKIAVFALSGFLAAVAALLLNSRLGVARFDDARGLELDAITAVVLGGASIFGGKGTMLGTMLALFLVAVLRIGMGVANVKAEYQLAVIGTLLIVAVLAGNVATKLSAKR
ncbi:MAG: ABC transporter permease [Fimbriimonas sp.]|nr:ABC transporter permease [Fimbriimonas sp.]